MGRYNNGSGLFTAYEFKNRGVIKLAPDALVYINNSLGTFLLSPVSGKNQSVDFQDGVSSINIQSNVDPPGSSSATIEIVTPKYGEKSKYWVEYKSDNGNIYSIPLLLPLMEVQIYLKGRFLVGNKPQYYPAFWGFIVNVEESFSGGLWKFSLNCADMLHWWSWQQVAYRPSIQDDTFFQGLQGVTAFGSRFEEQNPFEIIYTLCQSVGMESFIPPSYLTKLTSSIIDRENDWNKFYGHVKDYWNQRLKQQANLLRMYGAGGKLVNNPSQQPDVINTSVPSSADPSQQAILQSPTFIFGDDDRYTKEYKIFHTYQAMGKSLAEAEYWNRLELAIELKNQVDYEFFQDVNGNLIFKPPFYNFNTKPFLPYRIKPQDITNFTSTMNTDELVTVVETQAGMISEFRDENPVGFAGYHADMDLIKRFGFRHKKVTAWYLSDSILCQSYSVGHMSICNAKAHTASVNIPGRPELKLGYPIYMEHNDTFYYVKSINHTFDFGGSFTTNLSLEAERKKVFDNNGNIQKSFIYKQNNSLNISEDDLIINPSSDNLPKTTSKDAINIKQKILREVGLVRSMNPGFYDLIKSDDPKEYTITTNSIPYTDEQGYKVVGGYRYGRGIVLTSGEQLDPSMVELSTKLSSDQINNQRQSQEILSIRPMAEMEGYFMEDYFKQTNKSEAESVIPEYLKFPDANGGIKSDNSTLAKKITNMTTGIEAPPEIPILKSIG